MSLSLQCRCRAPTRDRCPLNVLIIDDHPVLHEVLAAIVKRTFPNAHILLALDLSEAFALARSVPRLDVVLLDLGLPNCTGIEALSRFRTVYPEVPILIVSACEEKETVINAMRAGAMGYVPKTAKPQAIAGALRLVADRQIYVPTVAIENLFKTRKPANAHQLTDRQRDVMRLVIKGLANKEIARELDISQNTVKRHLQLVYTYFGVSSRTQAVLAATRNQPGFD